MSEDDEIKNVAGYIRVSTRKQKEEDSHIRQRKRLKEWAERNNVNIDFFEDIAISGQCDKRESYQDMMSEADNYDALVVRELSRFGRSLRKVLNDIQELRDKKDTDFVSIKENIDLSTAQGKLFFNIIGAFNQFWADLSRERTLEMIERRREEGKSIGRKSKLDFEQLKYAYILYHDEGFSYEDVANRLKDEYEFDKLDASTVMRNLKNLEDELRKEIE